MATVYTIIFIGSGLIFTRPGSVSEFVWTPRGGGVPKFGLTTPYVATPDLLRVPLKTAAMYYSMWFICLSVKVFFGYFLLILPLAKPINYLLAADFSCWTPWSGNLVNPSCAQVRGPLRRSSAAYHDLAQTLCLFMSACPCPARRADT